MTNTPEADKKLAQARAFLLELHRENQKKIGKDRAAVERYLTAFLGATVSAFYRLDSQFGKPKFGTTLSQWKETLTHGQREFFNSMTGHRGRDVHHEDIELSVRTSATEAYPISGLTVASGPLVGVVPNPVAGQQPAFASAFVTFEKFRLEGDDVHATAEKYLSMMEQLVEYFKQAE